MKSYYHILGAMTAVMALGSCSNSAHWTLKGEIPADEPTQVVIETLTFNGWQPSDTVTTDGSGRFKAEGEPKGYPDIYRIVTQSGETAYFPIDSIETISISGEKNSDGTLRWRTSGSFSAAMMTSADSIIAASIAANGREATLSDSLLKRSLASILLSDPASVGAYYIINKRIGGQPLFNPLSRTDLKLIGAVANAYNLYRPENPRTRELAELYVAGRRIVSPVQRPDTIHAVQIGHHEIELYDNNGKLRKLGDEVASNNLTLLNFTAYDLEESPAFNIILNKLYERYHKSGLQIYQVSVDPDELVWRRAAEALPWVTVYNPPVTGTQNLMKYNVTSVPTTFIIDGNGEIVERVDDITKLNERVANRIK